MSGVKGKKWNVVSSEDFGYGEGSEVTAFMTVPGGFLYRVVYLGKVALTFVPSPKED